MRKKKVLLMLLAMAVLHVGSMECRAESLYGQDFEVVQEKRYGTNVRTEGGNSFAAATEVPYYNTYTDGSVLYVGEGELSFGTDVDYFKFTVPSSGYYEVSWISMGPSVYGWNVGFYLNSENNLLVREDCKTDTNQGQAWLEHYYLYLEAGDTMYVRIAATDVNHLPEYDYQIGIVQLDSSTLSDSNVRISGENRFETAIAVAEREKNQFLEDGEKFSSVVLANAYNYPDALSGAALAGLDDSPILLVSTKEADNARTLSYVKENVEANGVVYVLGGLAVVPDSVVSELTAAGYQVERLAGDDRYATNRAIVDKMNVEKGTPVVVVSGNSFADALSISSYCNANGYPIFLTDNILSTESFQKIQEIAPNEIIIVGGPAAVSETVEQQLKSISTVKRYWGEDRYETSMVIAEAFKNGNQACICSGKNFPDALTASTFAGYYDAPILLVGDDYSRQYNWMKNQMGTNSRVFSTIYVGGESVILEDTMHTLFCGGFGWFVN